MKPKKITKYVSHKEHEGHQEHEGFFVYASGGLAMMILLYMPPAAG